MIQILRRSSLAATLLAVGVLFAQAAGSAASASADTCSVSNFVEYCSYAGVSVPRYTPRWFSAPGGNNLRDWSANEVADAYGGSVLKCTGYQREGSGLGGWLGCGTGTFANGIDSNYRGWIFVEQLANGPRVIYGQGRRHLPNV
jgi:hypothetical protein